MLAPYAGDLGLAAEGAARGDVDDPPAAGLDHVGYRAPGGIGGAEEVDRQGVVPGALPVLVGRLRDRVGVKTPALLTGTSSPPSAGGRSPTIARTASGSARSAPDEHVAVARERGRDLLRRVARRAVVHRDAVARCREPCATAAPIPREAPVTSTARPRVAITRPVRAAPARARRAARSCAARARPCPPRPPPARPRARAARDAGRSGRPGSAGARSPSPPRRRAARRSRRR